MTVNLDLSKQAKEVIFSRKTVKILLKTVKSITFDKVPVTRTTCQKDLGLYLHEKLSFYDHINVKISEENKGIGIIKRLSNTLPRNAFLTIYKSFIRPHLDYCDTIYYQPNNERFCTKIEPIHYNVAHAITSQAKLNKELGLESLKWRGWFR